MRLTNTRKLLMPMPLMILMLAGCQTPAPVRQCPERPEINPVLLVIPQPTYREKLAQVWLLPPNVTNSQSGIKR